MSHMSRMSGFRSFFSKKKSLTSSTTRKNKSNRKINQKNPMYVKLEEMDTLAAKYISGYKKHNTKIFKTVIPPLRNIVKENPRFLKVRFNRNQPDLSELSDEEYGDLVHQLTRKYNSGMKNTTRKHSTIRSHE